MTESSNDRVHSGSHKRRLLLNIVAGLVGIGLLGFLVWEVGVSEILGYVRRIGWFAPLLLLPSIGIAWCDAKGWACALPTSVRLPHIPLWRLSLARLAGEAVNNLTPTANLGGEPVKVYMLRAHGLPAEAGLASVVVAKTALTVSQIVFILLGIPFFLYRLGWIQQSWWVLGPLVLLSLRLYVVTYSLATPWADAYACALPKTIAPTLAETGAMGRTCRRNRYSFVPLL